MHSPQRIRVSLGPDPRTFFAVSDQGFRWGGVDDEFHGHVQDWLSGAGEEGGWKPGFEPDGALFGINGGYLITCKGGRHLAWNKKLAQANGYPGLAERLMRRSDKMKREGKWEEKWVCRFISLLSSPELLELPIQKSPAFREPPKGGFSMAYD